nr:hypothetical protein [Tanacetum cinerariifolium]
MTSLADKAILSGADNRPPMLEKDITCSSARNLFPPLDNPELTIQRRSRVDPTLLNDFEMATDENGDPPVPDLQTMEELCQPTLNGRGDDANKNLEKFLHVTQSIKGNGVIDDALRLYLFPHSLTHHATASFDRFPRNSINTFEQMENMFLGKYFSPSMVTKLRNEITNFHQRLDESLFEAWEHTVGQTQNVYAAGAYNQGGNSYQPHGASHGQNPPPAYQALGYQNPVHQALIPQPQVVTTTEFTNYMKANDDILKNMQTNMTSLTNSNLDLKNIFGQFMKMNTTSSSGSGTLPSNTITNPKEDLKGITTRSGNAYQGPTIPTTSSPPKVVECETEVTKDMTVIAPVAEPVDAPVSAMKPNPKSLIPYPSNLHDHKLRDKANGQKEKFFKIFQDLDFNISFADALILMPKFGPTIKSLLTNKEKLFKLVRTPLNESCSAVLLKKLQKKLGDPGKFLIPYVFVKVGAFHFPADFIVVGFDADPRVSLILKRSFLKTGGDLIDVYERELTHCVGKEALTFNLDQTSRYSTNYDSMSVKKIDLIDIRCEEYSQEVLGFSMSGNPTPSTEPIVSNFSPTLTHFRDSDFLLEETDAFLAIDDVPISPEINESYYDSEGDILLLEEFLNDDPSSPPLPP